MDTLLFYNRTWAFLAEVAAEHLKPGDLTRCTLETQSVCRSVVHLLEVLVPVCGALDLMQRKETVVGSAVSSIQIGLLVSKLAGNSRRD